jgi:hypothetical protein
MINFDGTTFPTTGGQYKIVDLADTAGEIDITVSKATGTGTGVWDSKATNSSTATVTVEGGKIKVSIPEITLAPSPGTSTTGDATFSGNLAQQ